MVAYQEEVRDPTRIVEVLNRVIMNAKRASAPAQINIPRDMWTQVIDIDLPAMVEFERPSGGDNAISEAAEMLSSSKNPIILKRLQSTIVKLMKEKLLMFFYNTYSF